VKKLRRKECLPGNYLNWWKYKVGLQLRVLSGVKLIVLFILMMLFYSQGYCENKANKMNMSDYNLKKFSDDIKDDDDIKGVYIETPGWPLNDIHMKIYDDIWPAIDELEKSNLIDGFHFIHHDKYREGRWREVVDIRIFNIDWINNENEIEKVLENHSLPHELGEFEDLSTIKKVLEHNVLESNSKLIAAFIKYQKGQNMTDVEKQEMMEQCFRQWIDDLYSQYDFDDSKKIKYFFNHSLRWLNQVSNNIRRNALISMRTKIENYSRANNLRATNFINVQDIKKLNQNVHRFNGNLTLAFREYKKYHVNNIEKQATLKELFGNEKWEQLFGDKTWNDFNVDLKYGIIKFLKRGLYYNLKMMNRQAWQQLTNYQKKRNCEKWCKELIIEQCFSQWVHYLYSQYGIKNLEESKYCFDNALFLATDSTRRWMLQKILDSL